MCVDGGLVVQVHEGQGLPVAGFDGLEGRLGETGLGQEPTIAAAGIGVRQVGLVGLQQRDQVAEDPGVES